MTGKGWADPQLSVDGATFGAVVRAYETALDKDGTPLNMDSIIISQRERVYEHYFASARKLNNLRSITKMVLTISLGIAIDRGLTLRGTKLTLDTPIWPLFEGRVTPTNPRNIPKLEKIKLRHLLDNTMGYSQGLMFTKDVKGRDSDELLDYAWNVDLDFEPGTHFVYSGVGTFLLSVLIQEELGVDLSTWVRDLLFEPLSITEFGWEMWGKIRPGSTGLRLANHDLHKIGRLVLDDGIYDNRRVVPESWLEQMRTPQVLTPATFDAGRVFPKYAYGLGLWICRDSTYYCDGTGGQYLIVLPPSGIVITTLGHESDMRPVTECLRPVLGTNS